MTLLSVKIALNGTNHAVQIDPYSSTLDTVREYVSQITQLPYNEYYITVNGYKPIKNNVTLMHYNITPETKLVVHICGCGGDHSGILDRSSADTFLDSLPSLEDVQSRVNKRYSELTHVLPNGKQKPYVCAICDEFILSSHELTRMNPERLLKHREWFEWASYPDDTRTPELEAAFTFPNQHNFDFRGLALSPRTLLSTVVDRHQSKKMFTTCTHCYNCLYKMKHVPLYAIANRNYVGCTPQCLLDLTEIEVALLTPVKQHGFCLSYTGGPSLCLKGTFTFLRVHERSTARAIGQLEALGLQKHIVVLVNGNMTPWQHQWARKKAVI